MIRNDAIKKNIERVFQVWAERNVYDKTFVDKLIEALYSKPKSSSFFFGSILF